MKRPFLAIIILLGLLASCGGSPGITSVEPKEVKSGMPGMIDIKGNGFKAGAVVTIAGVASPQTVVSGPTRVIALLPPNLPVGPATVVVENPDKKKFERPAALKVLSGLTIAKLDPPAVNQGEAATVQVTGDGFVPGIKAFLNNLPAEAEMKSERLLLLKVPTLPPGLATLRLETPDGGVAELPSGLQVLGADQQLSLRPLTDSSASLGLAAAQLKGRTGISAADFDGNGSMDFIVAATKGAALLLAEGNSFKDAISTSGLVPPPIAYGAVAADFDNDGLPDVMFTGQPAKLFHNLGGGKFEDVTARVGLPTGFISWSCAWADYDGDGLLDVYLGSLGDEDKLFHNLGGKFEEVFADRWGKVKEATAINNRQPSTFGSAFGDMDNDGYSELFAGIRGQESRFYRNAGGKDFVFANSAVGFNFFHNGIWDVNWGVDWVDFDNDGWLDLFATSGPIGAHLYRNIGGKTFTDVTAGTGVKFNESPLGPAWGDLDNDGWLDLALGHNQRGLALFRNNGDGSFEDVTEKLAIDTGNVINRPMGVIWVDFNHDGALDIYYAGFAQGNVMLVNSPYPGRHYLQVRLDGAAGNRQGIGAIVVLEVQGRKFTQQVAASGGYLAAPPPVLHFGLDRATTVDKLTVIWPGGSTQTMEQVAADQLLTVTQPGERKKITLPAAPPTPPPAPPSATPATGTSPQTPLPAGMIIPGSPAPSPGKPAAPAQPPK